MASEFNLKSFVLKMRVLICFLLKLFDEFQAIVACVRGPTLLDLEEIYETDTNTISYSYLVGSSCSILGSFGSKLQSLL